MSLQQSIGPTGSGSVGVILLGPNKVVETAGGSNGIGAVLLEGVWQCYDSAVSSAGVLVVHPPGDGGGGHGRFGLEILQRRRQRTWTL